MNTTKTSIAFSIAAVAFVARLCFAQAVLPGYLTDPSMMKGALAKDASYQTPDQFKYPDISTYYVKPTVTPEEEVKVGFFVVFQILTTRWS